MIAACDELMNSSSPNSSEKTHFSSTYILSNQNYDSGVEQLL